MSDVFCRIISEDRKHFLELYYDGDMRENPLEYTYCSVDLWHRREGCWVGSNYEWSDYRGIRDRYTDFDPYLWDTRVQKKLRTLDRNVKAIKNGHEPVYVVEPDSDYIKGLKQIIRKGGVVLPVWCHEHSGITFNCSGFPGMFDTGFVGYAYMTTEQIIKFGWPKGKRGRKKAAEEYIRCIVGEMAAWANGDVYGFAIFDKDGEFVEGCGGFYASHYGKEDWIEDMKGNAPEEFHPLFDEYYSGRGLDDLEYSRRIPPAA